MQENTTPTGEEVDQQSSDIGNESLLENDNEQSAVEQHDDTGSSESTDQDSDSSSSTDDGSEDEKGLAKFAKSQGFDDFANLSDDAKRALKIARKQVQNERAKLQDEANQRKLQEEVDQLTKPKEDDDTNEILLKRMARLEASDLTTKFWQDNADDKQYEGKMAEILAKEKEQYGDAAAWNLAQNLPRLLREAKFASGAYDSDAARDAGRREERARLRKSQEGSADSPHATQSMSQGNKKVDRNWIDNEYDPHNAEHRKLLDEAIARGELY